MSDLQVHFLASSRAGFEKGGMSWMSRLKAGGRNTCVRGRRAVVFGLCDMRRSHRGGMKSGSRPHKPCRPGQVCQR